MDSLIVNPTQKYQELLLFHMMAIYQARKSTQRVGLDKYSDLMIDKFAIQSGTLFHLLNGLIESSDSNGKVRKKGFDLFSVNAITRVIIETYVTFHHLFINPKDEVEKDFKLLLWKLEGLFEKKKCRIYEADSAGVARALEDDENETSSISEKIENHKFRNCLKAEEFGRVYNRKDKKATWRFLHKDGNVRLLKIIDLVEYTCPMRAFFNLYRYGSMHIHSGFISIEHFEKVRGQLISERYVDNFPRLASVLTIFLICDIAEIDKNAKEVFDKFPWQDRQEFEGVNLEFRINHGKLQTDRFYEWR